MRKILQESSWKDVPREKAQILFHGVNIVRAGVVSHLREWRYGGWHEIVDPPRRFRIISRDCLKQLLDADEKTLTDSYKHWVEDSLQEGTKREKVWSEDVAAWFCRICGGYLPG